MTPEGNTATLKAELKDQLLRCLQREHETLSHAQRATHEGATHEEARPENDKDTRALEQSYLARGQAARVAQLERDLTLLQALALRSFEPGSTITVGALVCVEDAGTSQWLFLVPAGAGESLLVGELHVKTVTPHSPLGRALAGSVEGDELEVRGPAGKRLLSVIEVR